MSDETPNLPVHVVLPTGEELEKVRADIVALRELAMDENWYNLPSKRKATAVEILVSEADRKPNACVGHSARTALACGAYRMRGSTVCNIHGGSTKKAKKAARRRMVEELDNTLSRLIELRDQSDHLPTSHAACKTVLDRIMPVLKREAGNAAAKGPAGPIINVGVVLGGVGQQAQLTAGNHPIALLPAAVDAQVVKARE